MTEQGPTLPKTSDAFRRTPRPSRPTHLPLVPATWRPRTDRPRTARLKLRQVLVTTSCDVMYSPVNTDSPSSRSTRTCGHGWEAALALLLGAAVGGRRHVDAQTVHLHATTGCSWRRYHPRKQSCDARMATCTDEAGFQHSPVPQVFPPRPGLRPAEWCTSRT